MSVVINTLAADERFGLVDFSQRGAGVSCRAVGRTGTASDSIQVRVMHTKVIICNVWNLWKATFEISEGKLYFVKHQQNLMCRSQYVIQQPHNNKNCNNF